jgi:DNA-directed RNA polymerase subunit L
MNPKISTVSEDNGILNFTLSGVNVSLANALRRIILNDIDTVVFRTETYGDNKCTIGTNTGRLHNEILKQRLSCIPIHSTNFDELPGKYILEIHEKNETDHMLFVTTEHFKIKNKETNELMGKADVNRIFPADVKTRQHIDFCRLRPKIGDVPGEEIKLSCEFSIANAGVSSMFNAVSKCAYGNTIDAEKVKEAWEERENKMRADGATAEEIEYVKKNFYLLDAQRYFKENSFDFTVESVGVFSNNEIVKKACAIMQRKLLDFLANVEDGNVPIEPSVVTMENSWDVILENEDYTLGKALEYYLYEHFYNSKDNKKLNFCAFKKLHPHDASSRIRIAYANKVSENEIGQDLKEACTNLQEVYVAIHKML